MLLLSNPWHIFAQDWVATTAPNTEYLAVACSADATTLVASTFGDGIFISTNAGASWTQSTPPGAQWNGVACSADGSKIIAAARRPSLFYMDPESGPICISTNFGASWSATSFKDVFQDVACSGDGSTIAAVAFFPRGLSFGHSIYASTNSGEAWSLTTFNEGVFSVTCSADGTKLMTTGPVLVSTNSGATWIPNSLTNGDDVACSGSGNKVVVGDYVRRALYVSDDWGCTWSPGIGLASNAIISVTVSADGSAVAAAASSGPVFASRDAGLTWLPVGSLSTNWFSIASSADGNALVAATQNPDNPWYGLVYTYRSTPQPVLRIRPDGENLLLSWIIPSAKFSLQQSSRDFPNNWTDCTNQPAFNWQKLSCEVRLVRDDEARFFRLIAQ